MYPSSPYLIPIEPVILDNPVDVPDKPSLPCKVPVNTEFPTTEPVVLYLIPKLPVTDEYPVITPDSSSIAFIVPVTVDVPVIGFGANLYLSDNTTPVTVDKPVIVPTNACLPLMIH